MGDVTVLGSFAEFVLVPVPCENRMITKLHNGMFSQWQLFVVVLSILSHFFLRVDSMLLMLSAFLDHDVLEWFHCARTTAFDL